MDENAIKAIYIGASMMIAVTIISVVMFYFTYAKDTAGEIIQTKSVDSLFEDSVEKFLIKNRIMGYELKNILHYYYGTDNVQINLNSYYLLRTSGGAVSGSLTNFNNTSNPSRYANIIHNLAPGVQYKLEKSVVSGKIVYNISVLG